MQWQRTGDRIHLRVGWVWILAGSRRVKRQKEITFVILGTPNRKSSNIWLVEIGLWSRKSYDRNFLEGVKITKINCRKKNAGKNMEHQNLLKCPFFGTLFENKTSKKKRKKHLKTSFPPWHIEFFSSSIPGDPRTQGHKQLTNCDMVNCPLNKQWTWVTSNGPLWVGSLPTQSVKRCFFFSRNWCQRPVFQGPGLHFGTFGPHFLKKIFGMKSWKILS